VARDTVDREGIVREPCARKVEIGKQKQDKQCQSCRRNSGSEESSGERGGGGEALAINVGVRGVAAWVRLCVQEIAIGGGVLMLKPLLAQPPPFRSSYILLFSLLTSSHSSPNSNSNLHLCSSSGFSSNSNSGFTFGRR
jgi:hypothetical protein